MVNSIKPSTGHPVDWETILAERLPRFGHRNWVVIADSAYPAQVGDGIETMVTHADHLTVIKKVLTAIENQPHIRPTIMIDRELAFVSDDDAPGVARFREQLAQLLPVSDDLTLSHTRGLTLSDEKNTKGESVRAIRHLDIIIELGKAAKDYEVLILKTSFKIPYTTVFLRLECGYWDDAAEHRLWASL